MSGGTFDVSWNTARHVQRQACYSEVAQGSGEDEACLSSTKQGRIRMEALFDGMDFSATLTSAHFEVTNNDLFKITSGSVKQTLKDSG